MVFEVVLSNKRANIPKNQNYGYRKKACGLSETLLPLLACVKKYFGNKRIVPRLVLPPGAQNRWGEHPHKHTRTEYFMTTPRSSPSSFSLGKE